MLNHFDFADFLFCYSIRETFGSFAWKKQARSAGRPNLCQSLCALLQSVFASLDTVGKVAISWAKVAALKRTVISKTIFSSVKKSLLIVKKNNSSAF